MRRTEATCPICDKPPLAVYAPFCSKRCSQIDLGRWLGGEYRVPGEPADVTAADEISGDGDETG